MLKFKEKDLVLVRLNNSGQQGKKQPHFNVWLRVLFIDNNNTFIGNIERKHHEYILHKKNENITLNKVKVLNIYDASDGEQWCYSDNVTRCNCPGLCRNK